MFFVPNVKQGNTNDRYDPVAHPQRRIKRLLVVLQPYLVFYIIHQNDQVNDKKVECLIIVMLADLNLQSFLLLAAILRHAYEILSLLKAEAISKLPKLVPA